VYYGAANDIFHHRNPYIDKHLFTVFNYPLMTAFLFIPFLLFPYQISQAVFILISFLAFCLIIVLSLQITKQFSLVNFFLFFSLGFLSFPVKFTLGMGQDNLIAYVFLLGGFYFFLKQKQTCTIILLSLAILLKPVLLFTVLFFILRKSWRIILGTGSFLLASSLLTAIFFQTEFTYYITHSIPALLNLSGREVYYNQGITGFIARITPHLIVRSLLSDIFSLGIIAVVLFAVRKTKNNLLAFSLILTSLPMIDSLSWQHHFVFLLFPWIAAIYFVNTQNISKKWIIPIVLSYMLVSYNIKNPSLLSHFPYTLVLSHTFYGAGILLATLISLV